MNKMFEFASLTAVLVVGYATSAMATVVVPEPASAGFVVMGVASLLIARKLRRK